MAISECRIVLIWLASSPPGVEDGPAARVKINESVNLSSALSDEHGFGRVQPFGPG
jgi:hypothetical protein